MIHTKDGADSRREQYVCAVLAHYRATPTVLGHVRRADRDLAANFYDQDIPLYLVVNALLVAAARRVLHNAFSAPLPPIRSLAYVLPVITELQQRPLGPRDLDELRSRLRQALARPY